EEFGLQCPPNTTALGQFNLAFTAVHDAGECVSIVADAGVTTTTPVTVDNDDGSTGIFCYASSGGAGGSTISLVVPGGGGGPTRLVAGGFSSVQPHTSPTSGTACTCDVTIAESFNGVF